MEVTTVLDALPSTNISDAEKAADLGKVFAFVKEQATKLCETSNFIGKSKLKEELKIHGHMFQKTLDTITLYAKGKK